jgi:hypothetical protein
MLMQAPDEESTDEDEESDYTPPPSRITAVKRRSSQTTLGGPKKKIGVSLPKSKRASPEPIDLDKLLGGEESDEYMESDVGIFQPPKPDYNTDVVLSV